jgi:hypothetical protein
MMLADLAVRRTVLAGVLATMLALAASPTGSAMAASAPTRVHMTCLTFEEASVTRTQSTEAVRYWTTARMRMAPNLNQATFARALKARQDGTPDVAPGTTPRDASFRDCIPISLLAAGSRTLAAAQAPGTRGVTRGYRTVGKFFFNIAHLAHFNCTATVINDLNNNSKEELVLTAAHCFHGDYSGLQYYTDDWGYAPGWHDNQDPYGLWQVKARYLSSRWWTCGIIKCSFHGAYDYAIFIVRPQHHHGVGYYTGEDGVAWNMPRTMKVTVSGIPGNSNDTLVNTSVSHIVSRGGVSYRVAKTPRFGDGASGGPWFYKYDMRSELGYILGDTGGYQAGGASDSPSYSPLWVGTFGALLKLAARHE